MFKKRLLILVQLTIFAFPCLAAYAQPAIQAGTAQVEITPPLGCPMWGYSSRTEGANGVHDPLMAKVLILQSTETTVALVSWDVCEFQSPWLHQQMKPLGIDHLLLLCSHTHAGPFLDAPFPSADKPWKKTVEERILKAIQEAQAHLFPAYVAAGEGSITLGYNRLRRDPDGLSTTLFDNPERIPFGPVDPTAGVIRVTDEAGAVRAVLVHYGCHAVVMGPNNLKISADYVGAMYRAVEKELGGQALCLFAQGGAGDINPLFMARGEGREEDFEPVEKMGGFLAREVLAVLEQMKPVRGESRQLRASVETVQVHQRWAPDKDKLLKFGTTAVLINGEIGILTLPGEPFHKFQVDTRARAGLPHAYMFGYCDNTEQNWPDYYFPDIESAARGGYGAGDSGIAELGTGELLVNRGLIQLYTLRGLLSDTSKPYRVGKPY
ncbi:MAG: neutral/alkaline non-lysosomal ceramidase N-terminal domain-containing protein [bacterium]